MNDLTEPLIPGYKRISYYTGAPPAYLDSGPTGTLIGWVDIRVEPLLAGFASEGSTE